MAKLSILSIIKIGSKKHTATSWQVALDKDFTQIVDESINDHVNIISWSTPLKKINGGGYYSNMKELYARVKLHTDDFETEWRELNMCDQTARKNKILY